MLSWRLGSIDIYPQSSKIFGKERPPLMVSPTTSHLQQATRCAFPNKSALLYQPDRTAIVWLNVGLQPMQLELSKAVHQHQAHPLIHQSPARIRQERIVA